MKKIIITMQEIWQATKPIIFKNKKKYNRKNKYNIKNEINDDNRINK
jgi:hypothetical protein